MAEFFCDFRLRQSRRMSRTSAATVTSCEASFRISLPEVSQAAAAGCGDVRHAGVTAIRGGKSGLHRTEWWVTPTVREDRESATESKPPRESRVENRASRIRSASPSRLWILDSRLSGKGETVR